MREFLQYLIVMIQIRSAQIKGKGQQTFADLSDKTKDRLKRQGFRLLEHPGIVAGRSLVTDVLWW